MRVNLLPLLFSFFLLPQGLKAQYLIIQGKILNENGEAIEYVSISIPEANKTTVSDSKGYFQLVAPFKEISVRFFCIGYKDTTIKISQFQLNELKDLVFNLKIKLRRNLYELSEVIVAAGKDPIKEINPYKAFYIMDYELLNGNYVLQLLSDNTLLLLDKNDSVLCKEKLNFAVDTIYKDCLNNFYVFNKDSAYQFIIGLPKFHWFGSISTSYLKKIMYPCKAAIDTSYFFGKYYNNGQSILYWIAGRNMPKRNIKIIENKQMFENIQMAKTELAIYTKHYVPLNKTNVGVAKAAQSFVASATPQELSLAIGALQAQLNHNLQINVYYPLKKVKDTIYIFDHLADSIYVFDKNGTSIRNIKMYYHPDKAGASEIIVSEDGAQVYAKYQSHGATVLSQIDLSTGKITRKAKLQVHHYPQKIKVKNNFAYYMYKDRYGETTSNLLYKQFLEWEE